MKGRRVLGWVAVLALVLGACTTKADDPTTTSTTVPVTTTPITAPPVLTGVGITEGTITLAALLPLSGTLETFGHSVLEGHEVYWAYVNETLGGVGGVYPVRIAPLDTVYDEQTARSLWAGREDDILAISSVLGSPITEALVTEIGGERVLIAAGSQASSWAVSPNVVLNLAIPTYRDQIAGAVVAGGAEEPVVAANPPLGLIYQEGVFGEDCFVGFEQATARYPAGEAVSSRYPATATEFSDEVTTMQESAVQTLFVCSSPQAMLQIVATLDLLEFRPTLVVTSASYDASLPAALGGDGGEAAGLERLDNVFVVGSLPPFEGDAPGMKLLRDNLANYDTRLPDPRIINPWFFLGYTQAATFHLILEEALTGGDLTREGVWAARDRLGETDFGFGSGSVVYDADRIPVVTDVFSVPAVSTEYLFGMQPVGGFYSTR
ncbi:MAG: ABC transporter substrate-binding protein [Acidimicrobiia bacterium]|nr:ABC transporter substrate-binding protein [Acidimicrobiia bacterium]MDH3396442.1 ABC transporter substrate-binding protein [Acidimicrobiia bacterium]